MKTMDLSQESEEVKKFFMKLIADAENIVILPLTRGGPLLEIRLHYPLTAAERKKLMAKARQQTKGMLAKVLAKEIDEAVRTVRRRK